MRYWDASAVVPLLAEEAGTALARGWLKEDPHVATWGLTRLEVVAAIERRLREGALARETRRAALATLDRLAASWDEVTEMLAVRARAVALAARHPLRAADAAQLGAALLVAESDPASLTMVCLDRRLAEIADREGLRVLTWPATPDR